MKYDFINVKIGKVKIYWLIKKMQNFYLSLTNNIKAYLLLFKYLFWLFSKYMTKFIVFLSLNYLNTIFNHHAAIYILYQNRPL